MTMRWAAEPPLPASVVLLLQGSYPKAYVRGLGVRTGGGAMATIGDYFKEYDLSRDEVEARDSEIEAREAAVKEAVRARDEAAGALAEKEARFRDAINRRPDPSRVLLLHDREGKPFLVVPEEGDPGFRYLEVDTDDMEVPEA